MRLFLSRVYHGLVKYAMKFGVVGIFGYAIDVLIFNALRSGWAEFGSFVATPLEAKAISVAIATSATWVGNRYWTFREHRRTDHLAEFGEFALVALLGMGISVGTLYISHYVLGFTSALADNISANVVGLGIATIFRFLLYRFWVYSHKRNPSRRAADSVDSAL